MKNCLITCWFGKMPDYYKVWEYSCSYNTDYTFLLFTDQNVGTEYENIKIYHMTIEDLKELIRNKLSIDICINRPYKLCDFRPAYGLIFEEYIKEYDFWGHCDIDQVWGKISNFVTDDLLIKYDKINRNGPFTMYKNTSKINNMFRLSGGKFSYEEVFKNYENYAFDEFTGIDMIAESSKYRTINLNNYADIDTRYSRYKMHNDYNYDKQFFLWKDGRVYRISKNMNNSYDTKELIYVHFQKKKPSIECDINGKPFLIGSKGILDYCSENEDICNKKKGSLYEFTELVKYNINRLVQLFLCSKNCKKIFFRQRFGKKVNMDEK